MELAIDTSTAMASLALSQGGKLMMELTWHSAQNQTAELLPHLNFLLERTGVGLGELRAIAVARGPGSFNGVRVGLATAKGLALGLGLPLLGVSTLEAIAFAGHGLGLPLCPLLSAGRGQLAAALFQEQRGKWHQLLPEHITTGAEIASRLQGRTLFCGEITPEVRAELEQAMGRRALFLPTAAARAGLVAALSWPRLERGEGEDPAALRPLYLRPPSITLPKEAKNVGAG